MERNVHWGFVLPYYRNGHRANMVFIQPGGRDLCLFKIQWKHGLRTSVERGKGDCDRGYFNKPDMLRAFDDHGPVRGWVYLHPYHRWNGRRAGEAHYRKHRDGLYCGHMGRDPKYRLALCGLFYEILEGRYGNSRAREGGFPAHR